MTHTQRCADPLFTPVERFAFWDSVRIFLLLAALNNLDAKIADMWNIYLNAKCKEKAHVKIGSELFGVGHEGKTTVIVRAWYDLRSSGKTRRSESSAFITGKLRSYVECDSFTTVSISILGRSVTCIPTVSHSFNMTKATTSVTSYHNTKQLSTQLKSKTQLGFIQFLNGPGNWVYAIGMETYFIENLTANLV